MWTSRLSVIAWSCLFIVAASPTAAATNFSGASGGATGCDSDVNMADNKAHTVQFHYLTAEMESATTWVMTNSINSTDMNAYEDGTPDAHTDVVVTDTHYTTLCGRQWWRPGHTDPAHNHSHPIGLYVCEDNTNNGRCDQATVRYNNHWTDSYSGSYERSLACHEMGHSLGLLHRAEGCIEQGGGTAHYYSNHDKAHLNTEYD